MNYDTQIQGEQMNINTSFFLVFLISFYLVKPALWTGVLNILIILITLVGLYNTHVLNYTRNIKKKKKIAYQTP